MLFILPNQMAAPILTHRLLELFVKSFFFWTFWRFLGWISAKLASIRSNQQIDVSFLCVCPVIDHEFRHYIVKVAVDPRGDSRVDPQTALTM